MELKLLFVVLPLITIFLQWKAHVTLAVHCSRFIPNITQNIQVGYFDSLSRLIAANDVELSSGSPTWQNFSGIKLEIKCRKYFEWIEEFRELDEKLRFQCDHVEWIGPTDFKSVKCQLKCSAWKYDIATFKNSFTKRRNLTDYPWQAAIFKGDNYKCAGSIINPVGNKLVILTAANCFQDSRTVADVKSYKVVIGSFSSDIKQILKPFYTQFLHVKKIIIHEDYDYNYNGTENSNNIAIVETKLQIALTDFSLPICLPIDDDGEYSRLTGLGITVVRVINPKIKGKKSEHYKWIYADVFAVRTTRECETDTEYFGTSTFCTEQIFCYGDSGAAVALFDRRLVGSTFQMFMSIEGISTSPLGAYQCGYHSATRVKDFVPWILNTTANLVDTNTHTNVAILTEVSYTERISTLLGNFSNRNSSILNESGDTNTNIGNFTRPEFRKDSETEISTDETLRVNFSKVSLKSANTEDSQSLSSDVDNGNSSNTTTTTIAICITIIFVVFIISGVFFVFFRTYFKERVFTNVEMNSVDFTGDKSSEIQETDLKIDRTSILGIGVFGIVFRGEYKGQLVAVKTVHAGAEKEYLVALLSELKIMIHLKQHPNLVELIGANRKNLQNGELEVVIEYCAEGCLAKYLIKHRKEFECESNPNNESFTDFSTSQLLRWAYQICTAMEYLEGKNVIHSDLAARNVLLKEDLVAKVCDFGLSRKLYEFTEYIKKHQEPLPWRWMAIESLQRLEFSHKSDVWSFGVTLWEIFSLGDIPYPGMSYTTTFVSKLLDGLRLHSPKQATETIFNLTKKCWETDPDDRPNFSDLKTSLNAEISNTSVTVVVSDPEDYTVMDTEVLQSSGEYCFYQPKISTVVQGAAVTVVAVHI